MYDSELASAMRAGTFNVVPALLLKGANPNVKIRRRGFYLTPIYYALNHLDTARRLLESGADVNTRCLRGTSVLHLVTNTEVARLFIRHGANVNAQDAYGETPLVSAVKRKKGLTLIEELLKNGSDLSTALLYAIRNNNLCLIREFIRLGADVHANGGRYLREVNNVDIAQELIVQGASIQTPFLLNHAIETLKCYELVQFFIMQGINVNSVDSSKKTPIMYAIDHRDNIRIVADLLSHGADMNVTLGLSDSLPLLHHVRHADLLEIFLKHGADVNVCGAYSDTLLHYAIKIGRSYEYISKLLEYSANVNMLNASGETPLIVCITEPNRFDMRVVNDLLAKGTDVNLCDKEGKSALHYAVEKYISLPKDSVLTLVRRLLAFHADVNAKDLQNNTPLYYAVQRVKHDVGIVNELIMHGAKVHESYGALQNSLLHVVANPQALRELCRTALNLNVKNALGHNPLMHQFWTAKDRLSGNAYLISELLRYGYDINDMIIPEGTFGKRRLVQLISIFIFFSGSHWGFQGLQFIRDFSLKMLDDPIKSLLFLYNIEPIASISDKFVEGCKREISRMQSDQLNETLTVYDFLKITFVHRRVLSAYNLVTPSILETYPIYRPLLIEKIQYCDRRAIFQEKYFSTFARSLIHKYNISTELIENITSYLSNIDIKNCIFSVYLIESDAVEEEPVMQNVNERIRNSTLGENLFDDDDDDDSDF